MTLKQVQHDKQVQDDALKQDILVVVAFNLSILEKCKYGVELVGTKFTKGWMILKCYGAAAIIVNLVFCKIRNTVLAFRIDTVAA